jgi:hypothetical protein
MMKKQTDLAYVGTPEAAASYVATLVTELALVARNHGLDSLGYLLEMARLEAESLGQDAPRK